MKKLLMIIPLLFLFFIVETQELQAQTEVPTSFERPRLNPQRRNIGLILNTHLNRQIYGFDSVESDFTRVMPDISFGNDLFEQFSATNPEYSNLDLTGENVIVSMFIYDSTNFEKKLEYLVWLDQLPLLPGTDIRLFETNLPTTNFNLTFGFDTVNNRWLRNDFNNEYFNMNDNTNSDYLFILNVWTAPTEQSLFDFLDDYYDTPFATETYNEGFLDGINDLEINFITPIGRDIRVNLKTSDGLTSRDFIVSDVLPDVGSPELQQLISQAAASAFADGFARGIANDPTTEVNAIISFIPQLLGVVFAFFFTILSFQVFGVSALNIIGTLLALSIGILTYKIFFGR